MLIELQKLIQKWQSEDAEMTIFIDGTDIKSNEYGKLRVAQRRLRICIHELTLLLNTEKANGGQSDPAK